MKIIDVPTAILDLITLNDRVSAWGVPEEIAHSLRPVAPFNPTMLPDSVRPWVEDIAHRMQCPVDYVAVAATVMLASIVGTACGIRPKQQDNWTVVPNLWGAVVGRPGRLKSPALSAAMVPLYKLDHEAQAAYKAEKLVYDNNAMTRKLRAKFKTREIEKLEDTPDDAALNELTNLSGAAADEPTLRRYITNDSTVEMLGAILSTNPRGLLVMRDELMGLLEGFERSGREGERQFYLEAWNGTQSFHVDRITRGHIWIEKLSASLFGGIQPDKLENYIHDMQSAGNDGFIQRFQLLAYPDEVETFTIVDRAPDEAAKEAVIKLATRLADCDYVALGARMDDHDSNPYFRFEVKKAQPMFFKWLEQLDRRIRDEDTPLMEEHLGKYRKLVPALALTFHLVDLACGQVRCGSPVGVKCLQRAILWSEYLESHARRVYAMGTDYRVQAAQALAKKIETGHLQDGFNARDISRNDWSMLRDPDEVKAACHELEAAGWIRRMPKAAQDRSVGRPQSPKYEINPAVLGTSNARLAPTKPTKKRS